MKTKTIMALALAFSGLTAQAQTVELHLGDRTFSQGERIFIKQELAQEGIRAENYDLQSVRIVAEGYGVVSLMIGNQEVDRQTLRGNGRTRFNLYAGGRSVSDNANWQIRFQDRARVNVRRISVEIERNRGDWNGNEVRIYNRRLESFLGGVLNGQWNAPRGEFIVGVRLLNQLSSSRCDYRRGYDYNRNSVWVDNGCRGNFEIRTRSDRR